MGESIKKKLGEKLCHSISLKLVTDAVNVLPPAEKFNSSPISKFIETAISLSTETSETVLSSSHHWPSTTLLLNGREVCHVKLASLSMRFSKFVSSELGRFADSSLPRIRGVKVGAMLA